MILLISVDDVFIPTIYNFTWSRLCLNIIYYAWHSRFFYFCLCSHNTYLGKDEWSTFTHLQWVCVEDLKNGDPVTWWKWYVDVWIQWMVLFVQWTTLCI